MRVAIQQPNYIPWTGYFDIMRLADVFIWLDNVDYTKNCWRNRNKIVAGSSAPSWLTIPVLSRGRLGQLIMDTEIAYDKDWVRKHVSTLRQAYSKAPYGAVMLEVLEAHLLRRPRRLVDLTIPLGQAIGQALRLPTKFILASDLVPAECERNERVRALCVATGATEYLSGAAAKTYLDVEGLRGEGISTKFADYHYPPYQRGSNKPCAGLSVVDPWAWLGRSEFIDYLERNSCLPTE